MIFFFDCFIFIKINFSYIKNLNYIYFLSDIDSSFNFVVVRTSSFLRIERLCLSLDEPVNFNYLKYLWI